MDTNFFNLVYKAVKEIPCKSVATYGFIAAKCGNARLARQVGYALHKNPDPKNIPCHRVVTVNGDCSKAFAFGGIDAQRELLKAEGITFLPNDRVDMIRHALKGV